MPFVDVSPPLSSDDDEGERLLKEKRLSILARARTKRAEKQKIRQQNVGLYP